VEPRIVNLGARKLRRSLTAGVTLTLALHLTVGSAHAEPTVEKPSTSVASESVVEAPRLIPLPQVPVPEITSQTVDLDKGRATQTESTSQSQDWWIWASIAGVAIAVTAIVILSAPSDDAPDTTLGNMKAFR